VKSELDFGLPKLAPEIFSRVLERLPPMPGMNTPFCAAVFSRAWRSVACAETSVGLAFNASSMS
jgi:hypothetical protein